MDPTKSVTATGWLAVHPPEEWRAPLRGRLSFYQGNCTTHILPTLGKAVADLPPSFVPVAMLVSPAPEMILLAGWFPVLVGGSRGSCGA